MLQTIKNLLASKWLNQEAVLSYSLAFVAIWFGLNEMLYPQTWVDFAPAWLGTGKLAYYLVLAHGFVLFDAGVMLVINFHRRIAALILTLILTEIIVTLVMQQVSMDIIVRDVGVLGLALALLYKKS